MLLRVCALLTQEDLFWDIPPTTIHIETHHPPPAAISPQQYYHQAITMSSRCSRSVSPKPAGTGVSLFLSLAAASLPVLLFLSLARRPSPCHLSICPRWERHASGRLFKIWIIKSWSFIFDDRLMLSISFQRLSSSVIHLSGYTSFFNKLFTNCFFNLSSDGAVLGAYFAIKWSHANLQFPSGETIDLQFLWSN
jgi:hypothetical protein